MASFTRTTPKTSESSPASQAINTESPSQFLASTSQPTPARRLSESERREFLENEKQIKVVEKNRVCCKKCQQWIDLSSVHPYVTSNWVKHKIRCSEAMYVIQILFFNRTFADLSTLVQATVLPPRRESFALSMTPKSNHFRLDQLSVDFAVLLSNS